MSSIADAKQAIYNRLASAPTFHPASADLFTDWTLQGGDIITVESDNQDYVLPVYGMRIRWNGAPKVSVSSSGGQNRGSLEQMAQKQANTNKNRYYGGVRNSNQFETFRKDFYDEDGYFHSFVEATASSFRTEVESLQSDVRSFILQTPEMIHSEVGSAVSGFAQSVIEQTATYIRSEVSNAASAISHSVIEQTTEYVHTEVAAVASGVAWSVIEQTMTGIIQQVARKSKVYMQLTNPNDGVNEIHNGDIWIKADLQKTWDANSGNTWDSQASKEWRSKYGDKYYVWNNGVWVATLDTSRDIENEINIEHSDKIYAIDAKAKNLEGEEFRSRLEVTAREITSSVSSAKSQLYSMIQQTSTNIRAVVADEVAGLQSSIEQTAESITTSVSAAKSSLYSTIMQTATNIRLDVKNVTDGLQSSIEQTASSITTSVSAAKSAMYSTIMQTATNIRADVKNVTDGLQSSIEQTASSITTSVSAAKSAMYSTIMQTATNIRADVKNVTDGLQSSIEQTASSITTSVSAAKSAMYSVIEQTATQIMAEVANTASSLQSSITQQANRISLVVEGTGANAKIKPAEIVAAINDTTGQSTVTISADHINLSGYVKATDITSDFINGKIAGIQSVGVKDLAASGSISIKEGNVYYAVARSIKDLDLSQNGNTYTLKYKKWDDSNWTTLGSFSRAVTSVSWSLSDGELKVTPQPQNQEFTLGSLTSYRTFTHNAQETPSNFERATNGYYIKDSGLAATVRIYTGADMTIGGKVLYSTSCDVDDYLETMPTNVYHDAFSAGKAAISSSDITVFDLFTTNAPSTPSGYTRDNHGYYIKDAGTESAEVRIYTYAEITVNGKLLRTSSATQSEAKYDYLRVMPTYVYQDGFKAGYDADHSMFIGDSNEDDVGTSVNVEMGTPVEVWAYFKKKNNQYQWSSKYTFTAVNPYPNSIAVTKAMTGVDQSELPVYYGKLYALIQGSYQAITSNNYYWYYSSTNISSRTLHY